MMIKIIEENDNWLIIDKPPGVVSNRAETVKDATVQDWISQYLVEHGLAKWQGRNFVSLVEKAKWEKLVPADFDAQFGTPEEIFAQRQGLVHRLDKDTSGVMVCVKNPGALVNLLKQFKERRVEKEYLALVHGRPSPAEGSLRFPIGRSSRRPGKMSITSSGRPAETAYKLQQFWPLTEIIDNPKAWLKQISQHFSTDHFQLDELLSLLEQKNISQLYAEGFSLVRCFPKTGRMHQIRVHLAEVKHPIVGDRLYLGRKLMRSDEVWVNWLALRATSVLFFL